MFFSSEYMEDMLGINVKMFVQIHLARQVVSVSVQVTSKN